MNSFRQEPLDADFRNAILASHLDCANLFVVDEVVSFVTSDAQDFCDFADGIGGGDDVIRHERLLLRMRSVATVDVDEVIA